MSRINTNISSLIAQHQLKRSQGDLQLRLERLSTGLQINHGKDNPAGLIVSERLRSEVAGVTQSISNIERASNVISTTEAALSEISTLLNSIKGLVVEAANTGAFSPDEVKANQVQIDSAIESITRISNSASFAGLKLLNGAMDYVLSGIPVSAIRDVHVFGATFGSNSTVPVSVEVLNSAETAALFISGNGTGTFASAISLEVQGTNGVASFALPSGATMANLVNAINGLTTTTGVSASLVSALDPTQGVELHSTEYGSRQFVSLQRLAGNGNIGVTDILGTSALRDDGEDVLALVNGNLALGEGRKISMRSSTLSIEMLLTEDAVNSLATHNFTITGGGAMYQIGPTVNPTQQVGFGIQSVAASHLGNAEVGYLSSITSGGANSLVNGPAAEQAASAEQIIEAAIEQIAILRGRVGAFERNTLQTTLRSQQVALENLTASESVIRDTDFAKETANLTRSQILVNAGTATLSIANSSAQSVLALLQGI